MFYHIKRLWMKWRLRKYTKYICKDQTLTPEDQQWAKDFDWDSIDEA